MLINQAVENQPANARKWGFTKSKTGTPGLWVEFLFVEVKGPNDEEVSITDYWWLTDATIDFTLEKLEMMGWTGKSIFELETPVEQGGFNLGAKTVSLTTAMETWEGKLRPKVKFINDPDKPMITELESSEKKVLDVKIRAKLAAYRAKNKTATPPAATAAKPKSVKMSDLGPPPQPLESEPEPSYDEGAVAKTFAEKGF